MATQIHEATTEERFIDQPLGEKGKAAHAVISGNFLEIACTLDEFVPAGVERDNMHRKLDEARFWALEGVARNPETR